MKQLMGTLIAILMCCGISWARANIMSFEARDGQRFFWVTVNQDGSAKIEMDGQSGAYVIQVDSDGIVTAMERRRFVSRKAEGDLRSETLIAILEPLHGDEALRVLASVTRELKSLLDAPHISITPPYGAKTIIDKTEAFDELTRWYDRFYYYLPPEYLDLKPTTLGNIKSGGEDGRTEMLEQLKGVVKDANDGFANGEVAASPVMRNSRSKVKWEDLL